MYLRLFWWILILLFFVSCNKQQGSVSIDTGGIFTPILFEINNKNADGQTLDFGEHLLTDDPQNLTIKVNNNSDFPYTDLELIFSVDEDHSPSISFAPGSDGEVTFPGFEGTCTRILNPKTSCTIKATLAPRDERKYKETLTLNFKNYVTPESHVGVIVLIAGMPAALSFTNDQSQYTFGQIVGPASTPVVERADAVTYTQELEVVNAGGLPAKDLIVNQVETCASTSTNTCPTDMNGAYSIENFCPPRLEPKEKCKLILSFSPKNQDPESGTVSEDIKEINYRSNVRFSYIKDPKSGTGGLNAYFKSLSTNIEAKFKVAIKVLNFDPPVISGNRETRTFRINNLGYREGSIQTLDVRDSGGIRMVSCAATEGSSYLTCFNSSNTATTLSEFPFTIKDRNKCLTTPSEDKQLIPVGSGCIFDLIFQPSVTYLQNKETEFLNLQPEVVFDSRWRGVEKIVRSFLFEEGVSAKSRSAARLVMDKLSFNSVNYTASGDSPWSVNLGRLTLQSPLFFKRKPMILTFKNVGSIPATNLSFSDASGKSIPVGGSSVSLGVTQPYYYTGTIASESNCTIINPNETCSITFMFSPIGMDTNTEENSNMFDGIDLTLTPYKGIKANYTTGASFLDSNRFVDVPDYPPISVETRMKASLVRKGLLMQLTDDTRNVSGVGNGFNVVGDTIINHFFLQNIGTGPVPYFRLMDRPLNGISLIPTPDPETYGADFDCLSIGDEDFIGTVPANAHPSTRTGLFNSFPKEASCVYRVQFKATTDSKFHNASSSPCKMGLPTATNLDEGIRYFSRDAQQTGSGEDLWEFCNINSMQFSNITFNYYDGDSTDPALPPNSIYGNIFTLTDYNFQIFQNKRGKLIPYRFLPWLGATVYRPDFTYPQLSSTKTTLTIPETWFYGPLNEFYSLPLDPTMTSPFIKGGESRNFVPTLAGYAQRGNYDYIYYMGSFPQNSGPVSLSLGLKNYGNTGVKLLSYFTQPDAAFSIVSAPSTFPVIVSPTGDLTPQDFSLSTVTPGEHWLSIEYNIEDGSHIDPLIYASSSLPKNLGSAGRMQRTQKILIIGHVMETTQHPKISFSVQDYEVIQNDGVPPTEIIGQETSIPLSWNTTTAPSSLTFDTIKLTKAATPNDPYAKKRLIFRNNSNSVINNFKVLYRADVLTHLSKMLSPNFTMINGETTCAAGMSLAVGASCQMTLKYQPGSTESSDSFIATIQYEAAPGRYLMENVGVSLLPRSPGFVIAQGITPETINYKVTPTSSVSSRQSYPLNFGTTTLNIVPKSFSFNQSSGTFKKIQVANTQPTKASLLLSYHKYLSANSLRGFSPSSIPSTATIPDASEYRAVDGLSYSRIHRIKYSDNSDRFVVEASKGCFFGDDENNASIPLHQRGFNNTTTTPCYLIVTFNANFEYLLKTISVTNGDDMRGIASELWYYSVNRSSTASLWVHLKGSINPDVSIATTSYTNVTAFENKSVYFNAPKFNPTTSSVGDVVGVRILYSSSSSGLSNPYAAISTYVDVKPYSPSSPQLASILTGLANGQFFYFRAVAIRKDSRFVDTAPKKFLGLGAGEYLSLANNLATPLGALVPPINHYYFHDQKLVVDKSLTNGVQFETYSQSSARCTGRARMILKNPSAINYPYQLIKKSTWNLIAPIPSATNYIGSDQIFHWLADSPSSIDTTLGNLMGFLPNQASQLLESSKVFYIRNSSTPASSVNHAIGGIPGTTFSNFYSLVDGKIAFGSARCMVVLP